MKRTLFAWAAAVLLAVLLVPGHRAWAAQPSTHPAPAAVAASASTSAIPADIPLRRDTPTEGVSGGHIVLALWMFLALGALVWVTTRYGRRHQRATSKRQDANWGLGLARLFGRPPTADLRVTSTARLTARHSVHVVSWQQTDYLLGCSEHGVTLLDQRARPDSAAPAEPTSP